MVKNYTLGILLPIIYIGAFERVLFFHQCAAQGPCDRRTRALLFICCKFQQVKVRFVVQGYKNYYNFQIYPTQTPLPTASILEALVEISSCFSLNDSSVCCTSLQNKLQTLFLGVQNHVLCLSIIEGKISQQLDKSKFGLLCKATKMITTFVFTPLKTRFPVSLL